MRTLFADTGYWMAVIYPRDPLHRQAMALTQMLSPFATVTTQMVL